MYGVSPRAYTFHRAWQRSSRAGSGFPDGTFETLLKPENKATLTNILTYHVAPGTMTAADLMEKTKAMGGMYKMTTASGGTITAEMKDGALYILDAKGQWSKVTIANVMQSNGVIHVVDTVLLPG